MNYAKDYFNEVFEALNVIQITDSHNKELCFQDTLTMIANKIEIAKNEGGLIFFAGNGASATMAEHMSHDFFQNAEINTQTCSETSHITAIGNDYGYDRVFSYRISRVLTYKDILFTISSSGNSQNIINALEAGREQKSFIITLSGKEKSNCSRKKGDINFYVPLTTYGLVESAHAIVLHLILDYYLDYCMKGRH